MKENKEASWKIFEKIASRYDLANRVLSLGLDKSWRKRMLDFLPEKKSMVHLDVATGTGDVIVLLRSSSNLISKSIGIDKSPKVLMLAEKKIIRHPFYSSTTLKIGDGEKLPLDASSVDVATLAFGIRNFASVEKGLAELYRVLKKGGRAMILEFSTPKNSLIRVLYFFFLRTFVPLVGGVISGSLSSYRYLNRTIESFPSGDDFVALMQKSKFENIFVVPMLFGGVTLYVGERKK